MKMVYEKVCPDEQASFRCLSWKGIEFDSPHHFHPEIEITQILSSSGELLVGDRLDTFAPGDLTMFGSDIPHRYKNWKSGNSQSRVVQFRIDAMGNHFFDLPECRAIRQLIQDSSRGLRFSEATRKVGCQVMTRLFRSPVGPMRFSLLVELLDMLSRDDGREPLASVDFQTQKDAKIDPRLETILAFIDDHWRETISLADVADVAGLHPQSISRFFRGHLGKTFQDYVIELRISRAARELLESQRAISDVAFACGFNNLANFNRLFRARYNIAPRDYRTKINST
jgi:AraC-like DNA-binding protein